MKIVKLILTLVVVAVSSPLCGQSGNPILNWGGRELTGQPIQNTADKWVFADTSGQTYLLIPQQHYLALTETTAKIDVELEVRQDSIKVLQKLLSKYEALDTLARINIRMQDQLLTISDSLYNGYQLLYTDLKRYVDRRKFSFVPGLGLIRVPGGKGRLVGALGIDNDKWHGQFQLGREHLGIIMGYRLSP